MSRASKLRRYLALPLTVLAVLVLLFEEVFWRWVTALGRWLAPRLPFFRLVEGLVERMSPRLVGLVFVIPLAILVPIKLAAVWLIVRGHVVSGVAVIIAAKTTATAISARLFALAKPKLMQLPSFVWAYGHVTSWIRFAHEYAEALPAWQRTRAFFRRLRERLGAGGDGAFARLWRASLRRAARVKREF
jgi:hypothetical protein